MTEKEWMEAESAMPMLAYLRGTQNQTGQSWPTSAGRLHEGRAENCTSWKVVVFVHACCQRAARFPLHRNRYTLEGMVRLTEFVHGRIRLNDLILSLEAIQDAALNAHVAGKFFPWWQTRIDEPFEANLIALQVSRLAAWCLALESVRQHDPHDYSDCVAQRGNWLNHAPTVPQWQYAYQKEDEVHASILREIIGNPFRPVAIDPRWLTSNVLDLARTIDADEAFDRMPILADALLDAGCDNDDVLNHCRRTDGHVRGCWVVDRLLARE
jgi:hypothetical protein